MRNIQTYGMHNEFAIKDGNKESLSVIVNNRNSLVVDCPKHTIRSLINDENLITKSVKDKVDYLFITNLNNNNISGLIDLIIYKKSQNNKKLNLVINSEIYAQLLEKLKHLFPGGNSLDVSSLVNPIYLDYSSEVNIPGFGKIRSFCETTKNAIGINTMAIQVFDELGENIVNFSGNIPPDKDILKFLAEKGAPIIYGIGNDNLGSTSNTFINNLLENAPENMHSKLFLNQIPEDEELSIKEFINKEKSGIRLANELYSNSLKKKLYSNTFSRKPIVFSGSFDPWTHGHESVVSDYLTANQGGKVLIVIGENSSKKYTFTAEERKFLIEQSLSEDIKDNVKVDIYNGVIADYVYENGYSGILKGIRNSEDFTYEKDIAYLSGQFSGDIKTLLIPLTNLNLLGVSSSSLKGLLKFGGKTDLYATPIIREALRMKQTGQLILGLTGGIASGKSTLGAGLEKESEKRDTSIHYLNMDKISGKIHTETGLAIYQETRNKIAKEFGQNVLNGNGTTNKKILGEMVFGNSEKMEKLMEIILEPLMYFLRQDIQKIKTPGIILVEGAVIFDRKLTHIFDENIVHIGVDKNEQVKRMKKRDGFDDKQAANRLNSQIPTKDVLEGIKVLQKKSKNRLLVDINGADYDIKEIYKKLEGEYINRKKMNHSKD